MGVGDYIIPYRTERMKNRINKCVNEYKDKFAIYHGRSVELKKAEKYYSDVRSRIKPLEPDEEPYPDDYFDEYPTEENVKENFPELKSKGVDVLNSYIEHDIQADTRMECHEDLKINTSNEVKVDYRAIRVFFACGSTSSFFEHLEKEKLRFDCNEYGKYDYDVEESYDVPTTDIYGNKLEQSIDLYSNFW